MALDDPFLWVSKDAHFSVTALDKVIQTPLLGISKERMPGPHLQIGINRVDGASAHWL